MKLFYCVVNVRRRKMQIISNSAFMARKRVAVELGVPINTVKIARVENLD